jgi:hypothetical protein
MQHRETLTILPIGNSWHVRTDNQKTKELFGTDTLPTPFLISTPADYVLAKLQALNPTANVQLA